MYQIRRKRRESIYEMGGLFMEVYLSKLESVFGL